ncbi:hypothetical protein, partial [Falsiroseomonas oryziterrae]|uniref:hypothetical protein n=1 Tax=Falsiroseomonas oryziterrae TaxID=2911368 RepID=UPI001F35D890
RPRDEPRTAPWPPLRPALAPEGPVTAPEGRLGDLWFGLLPERMTIPGAVRAQDAGGGFLPRVAEPGPLRLWRGRVRAAAGDPARPGATDLLEAAEPVPDVAPIPFGGLLMAGPGQLFSLADPPSILLAQLDPTGAREERLRRLRPDGAPVWDIALPTSETIAWVSAEPGRLWFLATPRRSFAALHAIALADGRIIRTRHI